jgi:peptidoglycan/LPS O-acetylase OafA/YrhL
LHLWFLEDLLILTLAWCAWRYLTERWPSSATGRRIVPAGRCWLCLTLPLWLAGPTALVLAVSLRPAVEHHNSFFPDGWRLLYFGAYFVAGSALYRTRQELREVFRFGAVHLALSLPAAVGMLLLLQRHLAGASGWLEQTALALALSLVAWLSLFGLVGLSLRHLNGERPAWRYLADASYWVYLSHVPLVSLIQLDLEGVALPAGVKFLIVLGLTLLLTLASYHTVVRYTFVGACLHGRRRRAPTPAPSGELLAA